MKKIQFQKKLALNKESISRLNTTNLSRVKGGGPIIPKTISISGVCCFIDSIQHHCITVRCEKK